ncbi:squalene epoxidase-domain-containing protein [Neurospora tetraspora]|uniref:Squalene monooxygenase n=1 Tax=Neurospora tetraspora TaxID=94610 RepID=A0AAE0MNQ8_9PEZI|nr:squalene epoxidase-domain-containing protein [Neurospora tetraspora]
MTIDTDSAEVRNAQRREKFHEADVVIVGAGVFGCAAAYALANQGRSVILLERWMHEPDRIVGELLQPGGLQALQKLGLGHCVEGIDAITCYGYHVVFHGEEVAIPYPVVDDQGKVHSGEAAARVESTTSNGGKTNNGPQKLRRPEGRSFHHGRFISQLRKACASHPNITIFETTVTSVIRGSHSEQVLGVETLTTDRSTGEKQPDFFFGQLTLIADGYDSKFRKQLLPPGPNTTPVVRSKFYALELIDCPFPPSNYGHVVIGKTSPILLYQIGTHETRALIDIPHNLPAASPANGGVRGYIENTVVPTLPASVRPSVLAALEDGKIPRSMPNSYLPASGKANTARTPGVLLLGDAYNMRHPLTGGGMTVAFSDVVLLASLLHPDRVPNLADSAAVETAMKEFHWRRKAWTSIINTLAQALYSLFAADDWQLDALRKGCFAYFQMGGAKTDEPVALMGGLLHEPVVLARHFFTVAFVAIWLHMCERVGSVWGLWKAPLVLVDAVLILWKACVVFLPTIWKEAV